MKKKHLKKIFEIIDEVQHEYDVEYQLITNHYYQDEGVDEVSSYERILLVGVGGISIQGLVLYMDNPLDLKDLTKDLLIQATLKNTRLSSLPLLPPLSPTKRCK